MIVQCYSLHDEPLGLLDITCEGEYSASEEDITSWLSEHWEEFHVLEEHELDPWSVDDFVKYLNENTILNAERVFVYDLMSASPGKGKSHWIVEFYDQHGSLISEHVIKNKTKEQALTLANSQAAEMDEELIDGVTNISLREFNFLLQIAPADIIKPCESYEEAVKIAIKYYGSKEKAIANYISMDDPNNENNWVITNHSGTAYPIDVVHRAISALAEEANPSKEDRLTEEDLRDVYNTIIAELQEPSYSFLYSSVMDRLYANPNHRSNKENNLKQAVLTLLNTIIEVVNNQNREMTNDHCRVTDKLNQNVTTDNGEPVELDTQDELMNLAASLSEFVANIQEIRTEIQESS